MAQAGDDIRERLEAIVEELADLAMDALRRSIEAGDDTRRPSEEKRLTQARRAVERAIHSLREADTPTD